MARLRSTRVWFALGAIAAAVDACSLYDPSLLEPAPPAGSGGLEPGGTAGSIGDDAASGSSGAGVAGTFGAASGDSAAGEAGTATGGSGTSGGVGGGVCAPR